MDHEISKKHALMLVVAAAVATLGFAPCAAPPPCECASGASSSSSIRAPASTTTSDTDRSHGEEPAAFHEVRSGDTLSWIAEVHGVTTHELAERNDLEDADRIAVGQRLRLPADARRVHTVRAGETLTSIASSHAIPVSTIRERNALQGDRLQVGQVLSLPLEAQLPARPAPVPPDRGLSDRTERRTEERTEEEGDRTHREHRPASVDHDGDRVRIRVARADALLAMAEEHYLEARFDPARERVLEARALLAGEPGAADLRAYSHFVEGCALAGLGRDDEARLAFERTRSIRQDFVPPSAWLSPRIRALYGMPDPDDPVADRSGLR